MGARERLLARAQGTSLGAGDAHALPDMTSGDFDKVPKAAYLQLGRPLKER